MFAWGGIKRLMAVCTIVLWSGMACAEAPWQRWFADGGLDDFRIVSGSATYRVEDGVLVGTTTEGSPNTFLVTKDPVRDFELEFEVLVDDALNSGVQVRSHLAAEGETPEGARFAARRAALWTAVRDLDRRTCRQLLRRGPAGHLVEHAHRDRRDPHRCGAKGLPEGGVEPLPRRGRGRPLPQLDQRRAHRRLPPAPRPRGSHRLPGARHREGLRSVRGAVAAGALRPLP